MGVNCYGSQWVQAISPTVGLVKRCGSQWVQPIYVMGVKCNGRTHLSCSWGQWPPINVFIFCTCEVYMLRVCDVCSHSAHVKYTC